MNEDRMIDKLTNFIFFSFFSGWNLCFNTEGLEKLNGVAGNLLLFLCIIFFKLLFPGPFSQLFGTIL